MSKKLGDFTLREIVEECNANTDSCGGCKFRGKDMCRIVSYCYDYLELDDIIDADEESDVQPEKNDSSANLEAKIEKLETAVNELMGGVFK